MGASLLMLVLLIKEYYSAWESEGREKMATVLPTQQNKKTKNNSKKGNIIMFLF